MRLPNGKVQKFRRSTQDFGCAHELTFSSFHRLPVLGRDRTRVCEGGPPPLEVGEPMRHPLVARTFFFLTYGNRSSGPPGPKDLGHPPPALTAPGCHPGGQPNG